MTITVSQAEILKSLSNTCKDIKNGKAIKKARPISELFKEFPTNQIVKNNTPSKRFNHSY